ncbi:MULTISPECIES: hypothetical protein [Protofrankia]|uniref:Uncharacterized protein n=1 Tax=Candidatus Protofrankia datiscae TaxID=2716812 RepID=F8B058_9ACTN|nr:MULTISPECIES: hypothetical protein [Protofrankia]AEH11761.1 hypothetical protein FsymDg_4513 [Candidatus Protofrankia datiscae]
MNLSITATLTRPTGKNTAAFPATLAMALVRAGTFLTWRRIPTMLDLPARAASTARAVWARIDYVGQTTNTLLALDQLLDTLLTTPPPIDYGRRRRIFRDIDLLDEQRLDSACRHAAIRPNTARRRHATMRIWEVLTGGDIRLHPAYLAPHDHRQRAAYTGFVAGAGSALADHLHREIEGCGKPVS